MSQFSKPHARKPYSSHSDDSHLEIVLHQNFKDEYCTHVLNNQTGGFVHGHYFGKDAQGLSDALKDFNARGVETKLNGAPIDPSSSELTENEIIILELSLRRERLIEEIRTIEARIDGLRPVDYPKNLLYSAEKTK